MKIEEIDKVVIELADIRAQKGMLSRREASLAMPILYDISELSQVYDWFMEYYDFKETDLWRKKFIFVALFFFSPHSLSGAKIRRGLREKIASLLGYSPSNVSHDYQKVYFLYKTYRDFREDLKKVIEYVHTKIKEERDSHF